MNRLIRVAWLQIFVIVAQALLVDRGLGLNASGWLKLLDLALLVLAIWLSRTKPWLPNEPAARIPFFGPWPKHWKPVGSLGAGLAALNLAGFLDLVFLSFPWQDAKPRIGFYALQYAAMALLFLWVLRGDALAGEPIRSGRLLRGFLFALPAAAALAFSAAAQSLGLPAIPATLGALVLALGLGVFLAGGPRPEPAADAEVEPPWLHAVREAAAQEERNRLARDLHDSIKQQLFTIQMSAATVRQRWQSDPDGAASALTRVEMGVRGAMAEARALLQQLRPHALSERGLIEALREQCESLEFRTGAQVKLELGESVPEDRLPFDAAEALFRMAQEALANVARHARPRQVTVFLGARNDRLTLRVHDDGQGFDPEQKATGMGLRNLRERAARLGADLRLTSRPGEGTTVEVSLPLLGSAGTAAAPRPLVISYLTKTHRAGWALFLLALMITGLSGIHPWFEPSWDILSMQTFALFWLWGSMRGGAWWQLRSKAWNPPLSPAERESLLAVNTQVYVAADLIALSLIVPGLTFPLYVGPRALAPIFALFVLVSLIGSLVLFHRRSEPKGRERGPQGWSVVGLGPVFAIVAALPFLSSWRSILPALSPSGWALLALCGLVAVEFGWRQPAQGAE